MVSTSFLDPVLSPLLGLPHLLAIIIISLGITIITTLAYKYLTDQKKMKALREEMKAYQAKIKKLSKTEPDKALKMQSEMMSKNTELMKQSFKPMLFTFLPLIIIFGWLNGHMAYESLTPGESFSVELEMDKNIEGLVTLSTKPQLQISTETPAEAEIVEGKVRWTLRGDAGEYQLMFDYQDLKATKNILITEKHGMYEQPVEKLDKPFKEVTIGNTKITPMAGVPLIGGWGWLGTYILFSFILSFGLRKLLRVA